MHVNTKITYDQLSTTNVLQHLEYNHKLIQIVNILNKSKPMINYTRIFYPYMSFKNFDSTPRNIGLMGLIGRFQNTYKVKF